MHWLFRTLVVVSLVALSGCRLFVHDTACEWDKPIYYNSSKDVISDPTALRIAKHNEAGQKHCGWIPPNPETDAKKEPESEPKK